MSVQPITKTYTPSEVAAIFGLKTGTVYADLSRGRLSAHYFGRRRLVTEAQLLAYKEKRHQVVLVDMTYAFGPALNL